MSRKSEVKKQYPLTFDLAVSIDTSKNNKYLKWIASQLVTETKENVIKAIEIYDSFNHCFNEKDIYNLSVEQILKQEITKSKTAQKTSDKEKGSILLGSGDNWWCRRILARQAAILYGKGTKWCISSTSSDDFSQYLLYNVYIYSIDSVRYAVAYDSNDDCDPEFYDEKDEICSWANINSFGNFANCIQNDKYQTILQKSYDEEAVDINDFFKYLVDNDISQEDLEGDFLTISSFELKGIPSKETIKSIFNIIECDDVYNLIDFSKTDGILEVLLENKTKYKDIVEKYIEDKYEGYEKLLSQQELKRIEKQRLEKQKKLEEFLLKEKQKQAKKQEVLKSLKTLGISEEDVKLLFS